MQPMLCYCQPPVSIKMMDKWANYAGIASLNSSSNQFLSQVLATNGQGEGLGDMQPMVNFYQPMVFTILGDI